MALGGVAVKLVLHRGDVQVAGDVHLHIVGVGRGPRQRGIAARFDAELVCIKGRVGVLRRRTA
ncbi:hypothetical protein D3C71_1680240 [compost metagenome]